MTDTDPAAAADPPAAAAAAAENETIKTAGKVNKVVLYNTIVRDSVCVLWRINVACNV